TLEPPVAEEFGVVRCDDDGPSVHVLPEVPDLMDPVEDEVVRVQAGFPLGAFGVVRLLVRGAPGDAVVLEPRVGPDAPGKVRGQVLPGQVVPDVPVELAVVEVAGVPFRGAPDLFRRLEVSAEHGAAPGVG